MEKKWKPTKKWWSAYEELHGTSTLSLTPSTHLENGAPVIVSKPKPKRPKVEVPTEQEEQIIAVAWCQKNHILVHHSPNGGKRDLREAVKLKRMGVSSGYPDLTLNYARKGYHGLYIELKRVSGGRLSDNQLFWRDHLIKEGYAWHEAKGANEAISIIKDYLQWN